MDSYNITFYPNCKLKTIYKREEGKEYIQLFYSDTGARVVKKSEWWLLNGVYHREDNLPALIEYYRSGRVKMKWWYRNGNFIKQGRKTYEEAY